MFLVVFCNKDNNRKEQYFILPEQLAEPQSSLCIPEPSHDLPRGHVLDLDLDPLQVAEHAFQALQANHAPVKQIQYDLELKFRKS